MDDGVGACPEELVETLASGVVNQGHPSHSSRHDSDGHVLLAPYGHALKSFLKLWRKVS